MPDSDTARLIEELRQASLVLEDPSFDATDAELHARAAAALAAAEQELMRGWSEDEYFIALHRTEAEVEMLRVALAAAEERADRVEEAWVGQVMAYEAKIEAAEARVKELEAEAKERENADWWLAGLEETYAEPNQFCRSEDVAANGERDGNTCLAAIRGEARVEVLKHQLARLLVEADRLEKELA